MHLCQVNSINMHLFQVKLYVHLHLCQVNYINMHLFQVKLYDCAYAFVTATLY